MMMITSDDRSLLPGVGAAELLVENSPRRMGRSGPQKPPVLLQQPCPARPDASRGDHAR